MTVRGVDVSSVQGDVDFNWLVKQGIQFVIIKCYTGNDGKDPFYEKNLAGAAAAGLKFGIYHFIYPLPSDPAHPGRDPKAQAALHYKAAGDQKIVCCDLEWPEPQDWLKWHVDGQFIAKWTLEYLAEYERLSGVRPLIYTYYFYAQACNLPPQFAQYKLWDANFEHPPKVPKPWTDWVMQQEGGGTTGVTMRLPNGIPVDTDLAKDLSLWGDVPAAAVAPTPVQTPVVVAPEPVAPAVVPEPAPTPVAPALPTPATGSIVANIVQFILKLLGIKTQ
jgi:lysozyme